MNEIALIKVFMVVIGLAFIVLGTLMATWVSSFSTSKWDWLLPLIIMALGLLLEIVIFTDYIGKANG